MELRYVYSDELYHHGVKGMRWGHRKDNDSIYRSSRKENKEASKRLVDDGDSKTIGIRQKNNDILYISREDIKKLGPAGAEKKTLDYIKKMRAKSKTKIKINNPKRREELKVVNETIRNYDMTDPDAKEALKILREIQRSR